MNKLPLMIVLVLLSTLPLLGAGVYLFKLSNAPPAEAPLQIPEQFLGHWNPVSKPLAGVGVDINHDIIVYKHDKNYYRDADPEDLGIDSIQYYKVIDIGEDTFSVISKAFIADALHPKIVKTFDLKEYLPAQYGYVTFSIRQSDFGVNRFVLGASVEGCGLSEEDWHLPLATHRERLRSGYCDIFLRSYRGGLNGFWDRYLTTAETP